MAESPRPHYNPPVRILLVNKYHFLKGGAEKVYLDELELLRTAGHQVHVFAMADPDNWPAGGDEKYFVSAVNPGAPGGPWQAARAAGRLLYSHEAKRKLAKGATAIRGKERRADKAERDQDHADSGDELGQD